MGTAVPLKRPEFLKLVYLNCRNQAFTLGTGTRSSGPGQMMTGKPEVMPPGWQIASEKRASSERSIAGEKPTSHYLTATSHLSPVALAQLENSNPSRGSAN